MMKLLKAGDRVTLTRDTLMDRKGAQGTVVSKYVPAHCTGVWSLTVRWDGNRHDTSYPYPTGGVVVHSQLDPLDDNDAQRHAGLLPLNQRGTE